MYLLLLSAVFLTFGVQGCAGKIMPISNGSQNDLPEPGSTAIVWGQHKGAVGETVTLLQKFGLRIVERSRLQQVFEEQKIRLTYSTDDAQILKIGKILGADSIVFVETEASSSQRSGAFVNQYGGAAQSETITNISVAIRGVNVESGEVMWTGTSHYPQAINNPEAGIVYLTRSAVMRGLCPAGGWKNEDEGCDWDKAFGTGVIGFKAENKSTHQGRQLVVVTVMPNSPAEQAGLTVGDVILSCNGKSGFQTMGQFLLACKAERGQPLILQAKRGDKLTTISATAVSRTDVQK